MEISIDFIILEVYKVEKSPKECRSVCEISNNVLLF